MHDYSGTWSMRQVENRAGIRWKLSKGALIKNFYDRIRIDKNFVRKQSDFHACDFLSPEALQLTGLRTPALGPAK